MQKKKAGYYPKSIIYIRETKRREADVMERRSGISIRAAKREAEIAFLPLSIMYIRGMKAEGNVFKKRSGIRIKERKKPEQDAMGSRFIMSMREMRR